MYSGQYAEREQIWYVEIIIEQIIFVGLGEEELRKCKLAVLQMMRAWNLEGEERVPITKQQQKEGKVQGTRMHALQWCIHIAMILYYKRAWICMF